MSTPEDKLKSRYAPYKPEAEIQQLPNQGYAPYQPDSQPEGWGGSIVSTIAPALDIISRPQYASAIFADTMADQSKTIWDAITASISEFVDPKQRLSYSDVIKRRAPEFARNNPKATAVLGFMGDVALDPTTYLGIGFAKSGLTIGRRVLTDVGKDALLRLEKDLAGQTVLTAADKKLKTEIYKAGTKGISAAEQTLDKATVRAGVQQTKAALEKELQYLGIDPDIATKLASGQYAKSRSARLALDELNGIAPGIEYGKSKGVMRLLAPEEIRERAEQRIVRLAELDTAIADKYFHKPALSLKIGLPFGKQKDIMKILGVEALDKKIKSVATFRDLIIAKEIPIVSKTIDIAKGVGSTARRLFTRPDDEPFKATITQLENDKNFIVGNMERTAVRLFGDLDEAGRKKISELGIQIDDETRKMEKVWGRPVFQAEADIIHNNLVAKAALAPKEMAVFSQLTQDYKTAMELEMEAGLLESFLYNYYPRYYQALADPGETSVLFKNRNGFSTSLSSSKARDFETMEEAIAAGFQPELDAAKIYVARMTSSRRAMAVKQFEDNINVMYSMPEGTKIGSDIFNKTVPSEIKDDIRTLGESVYPSGMNEGVKNFLRGYDRLMGFYRKGATVAKLAFGPKQLTSNTMQLALGTGVSAFKSFDMRSMADAGLLLMDYYRGVGRKGLPEVFQTLFDKWTKGGTGADSVLAGRVAFERLVAEDDVQAFAKSYELINVFGQKYSGTDVIRLGREHGMVVNFDASGEQLFKQVQDLMEYNPNNRWKLTKELIKFWKYPSTFETYSRMMGFVQGLRMGYSPKQAAEVVQKNLFNYVTGLTKFEKDFVRRVVPFYSFQRFVFPALAQNIVRQPGNVATMEKFAGMMEKLIAPGDQRLTESEREILGDTVLIEQPFIFSGFDKEGKAAFNILNNFTPLDALSLFVYNQKTDELDVERTAQKTVLAALAPFIKIPIEVAVNKNFFSGRTIEEGGRIGNLQGGYADAIMSKVIPDPVKDFIGWENRVNQRTGKVNTYINPYLAHVSMAIFPSMRQFINPLDVEKTPIDKALELFIGAVTVKADLKEQKEWQEITDVGEAEKIRREIRRAMLIGSENEFEKSQRDYVDFIKTIEENHIRKNAATVRGQGIQTAAPTPIDVPQETR